MKSTALYLHLVASFAIVACSSNSATPGWIKSPDAGGSTDGGADGPLNPVGNVGNNGDSGPWLGNQSDAAPVGCQYHDSTDHDGDGFAGTNGDCNDCDPNTNPGAFDVPKNGFDEDCSGKADDEPTGCDSSLQLASATGLDGARAMDLCRQTTETAQGKNRTWGVISADFVTPDGQPMSGGNFDVGHGLLTKLGVNVPQEGSHMLAISSGTARDPSDPGYQSASGFDKQYTTGSPAPYPKDSPACPGVVTGQPHDGVALKLVIRVPTNAKSFSFNQNFFTFEFPDFICSAYNDSYVVMMSPNPNTKTPADSNIAYDQQGNPISVNNSLLQVCAPQCAPPFDPACKVFPCPLGASTLSGTGFGLGAATGWLKTTAPTDTLRGKDITILFAIWDSADGILDSSALIDNFVWSLDPATSGPVTVPNPPPK